METSTVISDFYKLNSGLFTVNFNDSEIIKGLKWPTGTNSKEIKDRIAELQRVKRLVKLHPDSERRLEKLNPKQVAKIAGQFGKLGSAHEITHESSRSFVKKHAKQFGGEDITRKIYQNAEGVVHNAHNLNVAIHNLNSKNTKALASHPVTDTTVQYFKGLPGYQDLFGNLDYCDCSECNSVLGPSAYFVDLLRIIKKYITADNEQTIPAGMSLNDRRPDLEKIELTCENTNHVIPYLSIINKRLEAVLMKALQVSDPEKLYPTVATTVYPFTLPYNLPLSEVRVYLERMSTSLSDIFRAFGVAENDLALESLQLTQESWKMLTTSTSDPATLQKYFGVDDLADLSEFNVFTTQTNLDVKQVEELLYQNLSTQGEQNELSSGLNKQFYINIGLSKPISVGVVNKQNTVQNLTPQADDKINRFVRLAQYLNWGFADLDWTLHALGQGKPAIGLLTLPKLAEFISFQAKTNLDIPSINALIFDMKTYGVGNNSQQSEALFDQVYNNGTSLIYHPRNSVKSTSPYSLNPLYTDEPWMWTVGSTQGEDPEYLSRIASSLGKTPEEVERLATALFETSKPIALNVPNLSALYRHSYFSGVLNLSISEYILLLEISGQKALVLTLEQCDQLFELGGLLADMNMTVYDLDYIVNGSSKGFVPSATVNISYQPEKVSEWLQSLPLLVVSTEQDPSRKALELLQKLSDQTGFFFGTTSAKAAALLGLVSSDPVRTFLDSNQGQAKTDIVVISRWLVYLQSVNLSEETLVNIQTAFKAYGSDNPSSLSLDTIGSLWKFQQLIVKFNDVKFRFLKFMSDIEAGSLDSAASVLSEATGWEKPLILKLFKDFTGDNQVVRLGQIQTATDLLKKTALTYEGLKSLLNLAGIGADKWSVFQKASSLLSSALKARFDAGSGWSELQTQVDGQIGGMKRDAIIGAVINYLRNQPSTAFVQNSRNLYEYLLLDVDMSECSQISLIKEGLNATQLYLNRCRAKLEPGIENMEIPTVWWEWMLNYRVWQSNREIFLYPENYIDPAFRKSKSSLFSQLENDIKQNDITDANVGLAFRKYMEGFAELAKLVYVDAYYCDVTDDSQVDEPNLYLFARTSTDPYTYYYIVRNSQGIWSEWTKIGITIHSGHVTPIYAFNKLFLFWVEKSLATDKDSSSSLEVVKASIKYTFYNFQGDWVQPQTLVQDRVIKAEPSSYRDLADVKKILPDDTFETHDLMWSKVYPFKVDKGKYWDLTNGANVFEKLVVMYGPMIDTAPDLGTISPGQKPTSKNKDLQSFERWLYDVTTNYAYLKGMKYEGQQPVFAPIVLNDQLDIDYLVNPDEILFLKRDDNSSNHLFTPQIDATSGKLNLISTNRSIFENYAGDAESEPSSTKDQTALKADSFISIPGNIDSTTSTFIFNQLKSDKIIDTNGLFIKPVNFASLKGWLSNILSGKKVILQYPLQVLATHYGTRSLSASLRNKNFGLISVKNAPGTFVFHGSKEFFLMEDPSIDPAFISDHLFNADTLFHEDSFISSAAKIDATGSKNIYDRLITYGYLADNGRLESYVELLQLQEDLKSILGSNYVQISSVVDVIVNSVLFTSSSFVSTHPLIDPKASSTIFQILIKSGYLDVNGRLTIDVDYGDLSDFLKANLNAEQARYVAQVLFLGHYPSSIGYYLPETPDNLACEYNFQATRLTTGAVHNLSSRLFVGGIDNLLSLESQLIPEIPELPFSRFGFSDTYVKSPEAIDGAEVDFEGAYQLYYWEIFYHAPMYISELLKTNQQFKDAEKWYKYIFDPTAEPYLIERNSFEIGSLGDRESNSVYNALLKAKVIDSKGYVSSTFSTKVDLATILKGMELKPIQLQSIQNVLLNHQVASEISRVWQFRLFRNHTVQSLLDNVTNEDQIAAYNQYPFEPDAIARLRIGAYEKTVVMQYVDNLIKWGDWYFTQYSWETITTASMLYIYAYNLLGPKPEDLGPCSIESPATFADIVKKYSDKIPQFKITLEDHVVPGSGGLAFQPYNDIDAYFCVPENSQLDHTWDVVIDRLYKINHCLNIDGIKQPLPLFQPPIDPAMLARAASSGGNPQTILAQKGKLPIYRFRTILDKAKSVTSSLNQLGASLLSAIEKKDESSLSRLKATQQDVLLNLTTLVKEKQIEQVQQSLDGLGQNLLGAKNREQYYQNQYNQNLSPLEIASLALMGASIVPQGVAIGIQGVSIAGYLAPNIFGFSDGGMHFGDAINMGSQIAQSTASIMSESAGILTTTAQFERRREEWKLQQETANYEVAQITSQINASTAQLAIMNQELVLHKEAIRQQDDYDQFLKDRFTNVDLYTWMISRLSTVYFQTYQIALDMALAAQSAYQNELDNEDQFIQFNNWDNLHKGLLAGEGIMLSLEQMENSYLNNNSRRYEIEKTISLLQLNPQKFVEFKTGLNGATKGQLDFELTEQLFDFDFPGQYCRKIKSISITIPAIVGPYQNINATLQQTTNAIILKPDIAAVKYAMGKTTTKPSPSVYREDYVPNQKIALSSGMNDSGMFQLNFADERYLPFEDSGVVSKWTLSLPPETNRFDFSSISDVIVKVSYTSKEDGALETAVKNELTSTSAPYPYQVAKQFMLQQAFSSAWTAFMNPLKTGASQEISFPLTDNVVLPNLEQVTLHNASVILLTKGGVAVSDKSTSFLSATFGSAAPQSFKVSNNVGSINLTGSFTKESVSLSFDIANTPDELLTSDKKQLDASKFTGMMFILAYTSNVY